MIPGEVGPVASGVSENNRPSQPYEFLLDVVVHMNVYVFGDPYGPQTHVTISVATLAPSSMIPVA